MQPRSPDCQSEQKHLYDLFYSYDGVRQRITDQGGTKAGENDQGNMTLVHDLEISLKKVNYDFRIFFFRAAKLDSVDCELQ